MFNNNPHALCNFCMQGKILLNLSCIVFGLSIALKVGAEDPGKVEPAPLNHSDPDQAVPKGSSRPTLRNMVFVCTRHDRIEPFAHTRMNVNPHGFCL